MVKITTLEDLVKLYKPCWACLYNHNCILGEECVSENHKGFKILDVAVMPDVLEYRQRLDLAEVSIQKDLEVVKRLTQTVEGILKAREYLGDIEYKIDFEGMSQDFRLLSYEILELASFSMEDALTGILNRRNFDARLDIEWRRAVRKRLPLSLILLDVDDFKLYNDTYGHLQGDEALKAVGGVFKKVAKRSGDLSARWGGEEFIILLAETDAAGAAVVAERVRVEISNQVIKSKEIGAEHITVSVGVTTIIPDLKNSIADFIEEADKALYAAKGLGKNRVCVYNSKVFDGVLDVMQKS